MAFKRSNAIQISRGVLQIRKSLISNELGLLWSFPRFAARSHLAGQSVPTTPCGRLHATAALSRDAEHRRTLIRSAALASYVCVEDSVQPVKWDANFPASAMTFRYKACRPVLDIAIIRDNYTLVIISTRHALERGLRNGVRGVDIFCIVAIGCSPDTVPPTAEDAKALHFVAVPSERR